LNYKLELATIDKNDNGMVLESKLNSLKNCLAIEFNNFNEFLTDMNMDNVFPKLR
jgi:hypothetical protein